jgi:hypothetical protein
LKLRPGPFEFMPSKEYELKFGIGGNNKKDKMRKTRGNMSPEAL